MVRVLILKSGAPHQSQAPSSEFKGGKSSDLTIRGAPSVPGPILGVQGGKSSDLKIRGAPSVPGSISEFKGPPGSAYRRIGVSAYFLPGSAYRRIGVFASWMGVSAYFSPP